jgi:molybdopterin-binding protein
MGPHPSGHLRLGEAARRLGTSVDTLRRWDRAGKLRTVRDGNGHRLVPRAELERVLGRPPTPSQARRNRLAGTVVAIEGDGVLACVEIRAGPYLVVALMSRPELADLRLEVGTKVTAVLDAAAILVAVSRQPPHGAVGSMR